MVAEEINHSEAVNFVLESTDAVSLFTQNLLAFMAEGRVAQIMTQTDSICEFAVQIESLSDSGCDCRNMERVFNPGADMIIFRREEDLSLVLQPAKREGVKNRGLIPEIISSNIWRTRYGAPLISRLGKRIYKGRREHGLLRC